MKQLIHHDIIIIGAGISGLNSAQILLESSKKDFCILEAKADAGGRIFGEKISNDSYNDLGPSWLWGGQYRIQKLLQKYDLDFFPQYETGNIVFQNQNGEVQYYPASAMTTGGYRIDGGYKKLITKMQKTLPGKHITYNSPVEEIIYSGETYTLYITGSEKTYTCKKIVFALPPRILLEHIDIGNILDQKQIQILQSIPTWMAGAIKVIIQYEKAFWRENGLSGNGMSYKGPIQQFHDSSPRDDSHDSIFGFIMSQYKVQETLEKDIIFQLKQLFGNDAENHTHIHIKDWNKDVYCSRNNDFFSGNHTHYSLPQSLIGINNDSLIFSSAEMSDTYGGVVEGALEASEQIYKWI